LAETTGNDRNVRRCGKSGIVCGNGDDFADRDVGGCRSLTAVGEEAEHYSQCTLRTQFTVPSVLLINGLISKICNEILKTDRAHF